MRVEPADTSSLRHGFHAKQRAETRRTGLLAGAIALIAFPAWGILDVVLLPDRAPSFIKVRVAFEVPIALAWLALRWPVTGERWTEHLAFAIVALVEVAIAWMIPRSQPELEAYLLGFSLAIYATGFLFVWRWQLTALLLAVAFGATAVTTTLARPLVSGGDVVTISAHRGPPGRAKRDEGRTARAAALAHRRRRNASHRPQGALSRPS